MPGSGIHFLIGHLIAMAIEGIGTDALEDAIAVTTTAWKAAAPVLAQVH